MKLGTQLVLGLATILLVTTVSGGLMTRWATDRRAEELRQVHAKTVGRALAVALVPSLLSERGRAELDQTLAQLGKHVGLEQVEVYDARQGRLSGRIVPESPLLYLRLAMQQRQQITRMTAGPRFEVNTPVIAAGGQLLGCVRIQLPLAAAAVALPGAFWVLLGLDAAVLLFFVWTVVTRYVARPVRALEVAAARVAGGDLSVRLSERGSTELSSLARSFNKMTAGLAEHLKHLERQRQSLIRTEKLASVGRLAAGVAHEIGNPLQSIVGFSDLLQSGDMQPDAARDALQRIQAEAERIHGIVRGLLDYSRPTDEALEPVHLAEVVERARQLLAPQKRFAQVTLALDAEALAALPPASGTTQRLVQVMVNLLLNAADAMGGSGTITIEGRAAEQLELRVSDDGPPIGPEARSKIFDPFFTTKDPGQGTGLGLAVSQTIVSSYGGRLELEDGQPTTFVVVLPRHGVQPCDHGEGDQPLRHPAG